MLWSKDNVHFPVHQLEDKYIQKLWSCTVGLKQTLPGSAASCSKSASHTSAHQGPGPLYENSLLGCCRSMDKRVRRQTFSQTYGNYRNVSGQFGCSPLPSLWRAWGWPWVVAGWAVGMEWKSILSASVLFCSFGQITFQKFCRSLVYSFIPQIFIRHILHVRYY